MHMTEPYGSWSDAQTLHDTALESIEKLADRLAETQKALRETEVSLPRALRKASKNGDLVSATIAADPSKRRQAVNEALCALEQQRHEARRARHRSELVEFESNRSEESCPAEGKGSSERCIVATWTGEEVDYPFSQSALVRGQLGRGK